MAKKKMPEPAKLYFENWEVLDTARDQLMSVLGSSWGDLWPMIEERLAQADHPNVWENKSSPGHWSLFYGPGKQSRKGKKREAKSLGMMILDPRLSDNISCYCLRIRCSHSHQRELEEAKPDAKAEIDKIAKKHGLTLDWGSSKRLYEREIPVDPEDLTKTWSNVADAVVELLEFLRHTDEWIRGDR